jgi:hypothetical protein
MNKADSNEKSRNNGQPQVEQVFLIYEDGRLIAYVSLGREKDYDKDILGGMLTGVMNLLSTVFVNKEAGEKDIQKYKFELGERSIILDMGEHFFIAMILTGREDEELRLKSRRVVGDIESKYGSVLEEWSGGMKDFAGAEEHIMSLLPLEELPEEGLEAIIEEEQREEIFEMWSTKLVSLMQAGFIPKSQTLTKLNLKLNFKNMKSKKKTD